jgi:hypothetical protein
VIFECWEDDEGLSLFPAGQDPVGQHGCLPDAQLLYTIEAGTWEEAMQKHYDRQGWGTYHPMEKT